MHHMYYGNQVSYLHGLYSSWELIPELFPHSNSPPIVLAGDNIPGVGDYLHVLFCLIL